MAECDSCREILELKRGRKGKWILISIEEEWEEEKEDN
jgi:hypothetical protein